MVTGALWTQIFGFKKLSAILYIYGWGWVPRGPVTIYNGFSGCKW